MGVTLSNLTTLIPSHILPAGVAGNPINLGLTDPPNHAGPVTVTIAGVPSGWTLSEGADSGDGRWTIQTSNVSTLSVTSPDNQAGAMALQVTMNWTKPDSSSGFARVTDNVELFAQGAPIFAWSGDDHLTGSSGKDLFVFAQPIGNDTIYGFNANEDQVNLIAYAGFASFDNVKSHLTADANGNAVITLADGQAITLDGVAAASLSANNFVFNQEPVTNNAGAMTIGDGAVLPLSGIIDNTGTIALDSAGDETRLELIQNGITLQGGAQLILSDSGENFISGTVPNVTLTNVDNTISGAGQLGAGQMTLVNDGTIAATGTHALIIDTGINVVINSGTLEATGSGGLFVNSDVANSGLISAFGGNITINGAVTGSGTAMISGTAALELGSASSTDITFAPDAAGTLILKDPADFTGTISGLSQDDQIDLSNISHAIASVYSITNSLSTDITTLAITDGTNTDTINLAGDYTINTSWHFSDDGHGGTLITYLPTYLPADSGTATINSGATLEIGGTSEQNISFANNDGNTGTLVLNDSAHFTGQISGFTGNTTISDVIDLKDINFAKAAETYTENSDGTGGTLTVSDGTDTAHINFSGGYVLGNFEFASDAQGGTLIMDPPVDDSPVSPPDINQGHTASSSENNGAYKVQGIDVPGIKNFVSQDGSFDHFDFGNEMSDVNLNPTSAQAATLIASNTRLATTFEGHDNFEFQQQVTAGDLAHPLNDFDNKIELNNPTANSNAVQQLLQDVKNDHDPLINGAHLGITFDTVQLPHGSLQDHFILHHP